MLTFACHAVFYNIKGVIPHKIPDIVASTHFDPPSLFAILTEPLWKN